MFKKIENLLRFVAYRIGRWCFDRIDRWRPSGPSFEGRLPPPDWICIETTRYCNLKCRMCLPYLDGITVTGPHMELEAFRRYAQATFPFATRFQPSVSGEPTMSKGFKEMLEIVRDFGLQMEIVTNGTLLTDKMLDVLLPCLGQISISFDGATKETFEAIREEGKYDRVVASIKRLVRRIREIPLHRRPTIVMLPTIMRRNIEELPALVELAHGLGVDMVCATHVFPASEEIKRQSLVHHQELARDCIEKTVDVARRLGMPLEIGPLDQFTATNALAQGLDRECSEVDGVVPGLEARTVCRERFREMPDPSQTYGNDARIEERGKKARTGIQVLEDRKPPRFPKRGETIWACKYLWNRAYIHVEGEVRPCCVEGTPVMGSLENEPFEEIWNNDLYRAMRHQLVTRNPQGVCKGCQHIQEISDPKQIARWLRGASVPSPEDVVQMPETQDAAPVEVQQP